MTLIGFKYFLVSSHKMKIVYIVTGYGRSGECYGEFAQAEASAMYAKNNNDISFIVKNKRLIEILQNEGFKVFHSDDTSTTKQLISKIAPDVVILCNSKTNYMYKFSIMREPPLEPKPLVCSIDSNWLFLDDKRIGFPVPAWIDRIYVSFPEEIYYMGLIENGGHYKISKHFKEKISCPGFIPSSEKITTSMKALIRKELGFEKEEKLIIIYFGILEESVLPKFLTQFSQAIEELIQDKLKIKVIFKGRTNIEKEWMKCITWINDTKKFNSILASADLVIQHHGLGTLPKLINNHVPAICLVEELQRDWPYYRHLAYYEIEPFSRLNLCKILPYSVTPEMLKATIMDLLYNQREINKMKNSQKIHFKSGEKNLIDDLAHFLKDK